MTTASRDTVPFERPFPFRSIALFATVVAVALLGTPADAPAQVWEVDADYVAGLIQDGQRLGEGFAVGDFDGDGLDDLYYGVPLFDSAEDRVDSGIVCSRRSLSDRTHESFDPQSGSCTYTSAGDRLGSAMVAADFDGDGRDEVAAGAPFADLAVNDGSIQAAGEVWVRDFDPVAKDWDLLIVNQNDTSSFSAPGGGDRFGDVLAAGDFDGDGYADLVVGTPMDDFGSELDVGSVQVFYGSATGLQPSVHQGFRAGHGGVLGSPMQGEHTGSALAAGDFDGDGYDDLAFSAPDRTVLASDDAGQVHVLYGTASGLGIAGQQLFDDHDFGLVQVEDGKRFGAALAAGDFDGNLLLCALGTCSDDLAVGVPGASVSGQQGAGKVRVLPGSGAGLDAGGVTTLTALATAFPPQAQARFGGSLAAGFTDPGLPEDLVVGSPHRNVQPGLVNDGHVTLFFGSSGGIDGGRPAQEIPYPPGASTLELQTGDAWGEVLRLGDLDGDGWGDLLVGIPSKNWASWGTDVGGIVTMFGALFADGFERGDATAWSAAVP